METPTVKERLSRMMLAGVLAAGVAVPALAAPPGALAADASVTVTSSQPGASGITYDVYKLFTADIDAQDKATNIAWASGVTAADVVAQLGSDYTAWLTANNHTESGAATNPQNAAEYIAQAISDSAGNGATPPSVAAGSFTSTFAKWCDDNLQKTSTVAAGTAFTGAEGYYLFVTTPSTVAGKVDAATNAIWVPVGGSATTVAEKVATPTVVKKIKEDSSVAEATADSYEVDAAGTYYHDLDNDTYVTDQPVNYEQDGGNPVMYALVPGASANDGWGDAADANRSQAIDYKLTGTLPSDLQAYSSYWYKFTDTLDPGLTYTPNSAVVKVVAADGTTKATVTDQATIACNDNVLTVEIADVKALTGVTVAATDTIVVEYQSTLNGDSIIYKTQAQKSDKVFSNVTQIGLSSGESWDDYSTATLVIATPDESATFPNAMYSINVGGNTYTVPFDGQTHSYDISIDDIRANATNNSGGSVTGGGPGIGSPDVSLTLTAKNVKQSNDNTVYLEYSNNPMTDGKGKSITDTVRAYTYQMNVVKKDKQTQETISGVKFTIQVAASNSDAGSVGKYVQADGSLGTTAYEFTTGANGSFNVPRIDEGTYTIHEVAAPTGYAQAADTTVVLSSNIAAVAADETGATELVLTGTVSGGNDATGSVSGGTASVTVNNTKEVELPLTGGAGIALVTIVGAAGIGLSIRALSRKKTESESE